MLLNVLEFALRNFKNSKFYSSINNLGLLIVLIALTLLSGCGDAMTSLDSSDKDDTVPFLVQVTHLTREPRLPAPTLSDLPVDSTTGWPKPGTTVTWVVYLRSTAPDTLTSIPWVWKEDGTTLETGVVDIPPGSSRMEFPWSWTFDRHRLEFALQIPNSINDSSEGDDTVVVFSDALSVGFWVEESIFTYLDNLRWGGFARWAYDQVRLFNVILDRANYPMLDEPRVLDRLRLGRVTVIPDDAPYPTDFDTDLHWVFRDGNSRKFLHTGSSDRTIENQVVVLHELLHQRGLTDLYAYEVLNGTPNNSEIRILENGEPVAGTSRLPVMINGRAWEPPFNGLMGSDYTTGAYVSEHTVYGVNLRAGLRTPHGFDNFGNDVNPFALNDYVNQLADSTRLVFVHRLTGEVMAGAGIDIFLDHGETFYRDIYLEEPDFSLVADSEGMIILPADLLEGTPTVESEYSKPWTLIIRVRDGDRTSYHFVSGYRLNLLDFRGEEDPRIFFEVTPE